jgi:cytochrome c peroxidase
MINTRLIKLVFVMCLGCAIVGSLVLGQDDGGQGEGQRPRDPGVRGGPPGAGVPIPNLQVNEDRLFREGFLRVVELEATCDSCPDVTPGGPPTEDPNRITLTNSAGLGARFNGDQCSVCHSQPAIGGSGGFLVPNPGDPNPRRPENPSFDLIPHRKGATNRVPSFITQFGPIREVRFVFKPDGTRDGGVHQLFTIVGRTDDPTIPGCAIQQPDFEREVTNHNVAFRIPLQLFGNGLMDKIQDREILARHDASAALRAKFGIEGIPNRSGNDGTITRFGWKAQNKSITVFAGEAYNVEMGVTNDLFPQAVEENEACNGPAKPHPNDVTRVAEDDRDNEAFNNPDHILPDWFQFVQFMNFLDGPQPVPFTPSAQRGRELFATVGCVGCHTPQMRTAPVIKSDALRDKPINLFSDLLIHHMGKGLADNIIQGAADVDMFRTTPLWGIGQRIFFLHDGRTSDLLEAIMAHSSPASEADPVLRLQALPASEANGSIQAFRKLSNRGKQDILNFLRSL